jgi:hypothetical protein
VFNSIRHGGKPTHGRAPPWARVARSPPAAPFLPRERHQAPNHTVRSHRPARRRRVQSHELVDQICVIAGVDLNAPVWGIHSRATDPVSRFPPPRTITETHYPNPLSPKSLSRHAHHQCVLASELSVSNHGPFPGCWSSALIVPLGKSEDVRHGSVYKAHAPGREKGCCQPLAGPFHKIRIPNDADWMFFHSRSCGAIQSRRMVWV